MARACEICGKKTTFGHNVSHAHNVTNRAFLPNLQRVRLHTLRPRPRACDLRWARPRTRRPRPGAFDLRWVRPRTPWRCPPFLPSCLP